MRYQTLLLRCECGRPANRVQDVGFTADHQLVLHWRCGACHKHVYILKSLSDCWQDCPSEQDLQYDEPAERKPVREPDEKFLHRLGVKFPDDPAC